MVKPSIITNSCGLEYSYGSKTPKFRKNLMVPNNSYGSKKFLWFRKNPRVPKNSYGSEKILRFQRVPMVWKQSYGSKNSSGLKPIDSWCYSSKKSRGLEKFLWFQKIPMIWESSNGLINDRSSYGSKCARFFWWFRKCSATKWNLMQKWLLYGPKTPSK